ncbi:MAG: prepilin-type N-terminal cleavage/methylation domain-containing protein [Planctomycetota bacterium]
MKGTRTVRRAGGAGFTLVEVMVSAALFCLVAYALLQAVTAARNSHESVLMAAAENEEIRSAAALLRDELRLASADNLAVTTLEGGNHEVAFQMPIVVLGALDWGVYDPSLGPDEESRNRPGWSVRYTVQQVPGAGGGIVRRLVRQVRDELGTVQKEKIVAEGIRLGTDDPPGFTMVQAGDVWEVTLTPEGRSASAGGRGVVLHVRLRN